MPPLDSLDAHDIYFSNEETLDSLGTCPTELQELFRLVVQVRDIKFDQFGGYETTGFDVLQMEPSPRQQYEKELKNEAVQLSADCNDKRRPDDTENKGVQTLEPVVFYRFDREQEERYKRERHHHCFVCGKHYPTKSRPLISRTSERGIEVRVEKWLEDDGKHLCQEHLNLPNFDAVEQLAYPQFENEQKKIPDLTIGLLSYDPKEWADLPNARLLQDDRVRLFDQSLLRKLEAAGYLKHPFIRPGSSGKCVSEVSLAFPFGFWEAKREDGGFDHQSAQKQNALKVKMILGWQGKTAERADVPWAPLVWYFSSVGSRWEVHGCYFKNNSFATDGRICVLRRLWSGDSANTDKALQLLYLVDIIALWGEHKYKPFAGACIRRLQAQLEKDVPPPLEDTTLAHQLEINSHTFSWLLPGRETSRPPAPSKTASCNGPMTARSQSQSRSQGLQTPELHQEIRHLSLAHHEKKSYIIPERDYFIWLLDRDPAKNDLLVVRIDEEGSILAPLLIFDSYAWEEHDFRCIIKSEQARRPNDILADFRLSRERRKYLKRCIARSTGYFREPQAQFCAIIPLEPKSYKRQLDADDPESPIFKSLELSLRLPELLDAAQEANEKWCQCQAIYNEYSPNMILCDNVKCTMGWYHKKCVGLDEDFAATCWLCKQCLENRQGVEIAEYQNREIDEDIQEASDLRIQRIKTLSRVWKEHRWPNPEEVRLLIDRTSCQININERKTFETVSHLDFKKSHESKCWAILKGTPKVMRAIRRHESHSSIGTNRRAHRLAYRKSDRDLPGVADGSVPPKQAAGLLALPQWGDERRRNASFGS